MTSGVESMHIITIGRSMVHVRRLHPLRRVSNTLCIRNFKSQVVNLNPIGRLMPTILEELMEYHQYILRRVAESLTKVEEDLSANFHERDTMNFVRPAWRQCCFITAATATFSMPVSQVNYALRNMFGPSHYFEITCGSTLARLSMQHVVRFNILFKLQCVLRYWQHLSITTILLTCMYGNLHRESRVCPTKDFNVFENPSRDLKHIYEKRCFCNPTSNIPVSQPLKFLMRSAIYTQRVLPSHQ